MNVESIRKILRGRPFRTLEVRLASGEKYRITHPEQIGAFGRGADGEVVFEAAPDYETHFVDVSNVEEIVRARPGRNSRKRDGDGERRGP